MECCIILIVAKCHRAVIVQRGLWQYITILRSPLDESGYRPSHLVDVEVDRTSGYLYHLVGQRIFRAGDEDARIGELLEVNLLGVFLGNTHILREDSAQDMDVSVLIQSSVGLVNQNDIVPLILQERIAALNEAPPILLVRQIIVHIIYYLEPLWLLR